MPYTERQRQAIRQARKALDTARTREYQGAPQVAAFWRGWLENALAGLLAALAEDDGEGGEPRHRPQLARDAHDCGPGDCACGIHVNHAGQVIPAVTP